MSPLTPKGALDAYELMEKLRSDHNGIEAIDVGMAHAGDCSCRIIYNGGREVFACGEDILESVLKAQEKWEDEQFSQASAPLRSDMLWWKFRRLEKELREQVAILTHAGTDHERAISRLFQRLDRQESAVMGLEEEHGDQKAAPP